MSNMSNIKIYCKDKNSLAKKNKFIFLNAKEVDFKYSFCETEKELYYWILIPESEWILLKEGFLNEQFSLRYTVSFSRIFERIEITSIEEEKPEVWIDIETFQKIEMKFVKVFLKKKLKNMN